MSQRVRRLNATGGIYHTIAVDSCLFIKGRYDMTNFLQYYHLPEDLSGKTALDIGTSTGFFAFELARRRAAVTAIDVAPGWQFEEVRDLLGLDVRFLQRDIYDIDENFGHFDLVFCGSVLLHLSNPFEAIRRIRSVCRHQAVVATTILDDSRCGDLPHCEFVGRRASDGDYWTYWTPNMTALKKMMIMAGFSTAEQVSQFELVTEPGFPEYRSLHGVVKASI
jgi:tRNA (mo5U34)-methyltransferase